MKSLIALLLLVGLSACGTADLDSVKDAANDAADAAKEAAEKAGDAADAVKDAMAKDKDAEPAAEKEEVNDGNTIEVKTEVKVGDSKIEAVVDAKNEPNKKAPRAE